MSPLLEARGLHVARGGRVVLRGLSVQFVAGQWVALVGSNGHGKSTLLATLAGLLKADQGQVLMRGRHLGEWPLQQRAQALGWLSQAGEAEGELSVLDVVRLGRLPHHGLWQAPTETDEAAVAAALRETDIVALAERRLAALSGGERQRVLLARLLAGQAPLMLLDEPAAHLDAPHQRALLAGLRRLADGGSCIVSALHDLTQALAADRVLLLVDGAIAADGAPGDAALHTALERAFQGAVHIVAVPLNGHSRWVAVPL